MPITPLFAALFAVFYIGLSVYVIRQRLRTQTSLGAGDDPMLERAVRGHANFSEYVPLALLLMWFVEMMTAMTMTVVGLGSLLLAGRTCHLIGMLKPALFKFRQAGMLATFLVLLACALLLVWPYVTGQAFIITGA